MEYVQNLYADSYKTLMKEIREDLNKCTYSRCLWTRRLDIVQMTILPQLIYRWSTASLKKPACYLWISTNWLWSLYDKLKDQD